MKNSSKIIILILFSFILSACSATNNKLDNLEKYFINSSELNTVVEEDENIDENPEEQNVEIDNKNLSKNKKPPFFYERPNNENLTSKFEETSSLENNEFQINVENIPIPKFIKLVFGELFKSNYTISDAVIKNNKTLTLDMSQKSNKDELYNIVETLLSSYNVNIEKKDGNYFFDLGTKKSELKLSSDFYYGKNLPDALNGNDLVSIFIPYYYVDLRELQDLIRTYYLSETFLFTKLKDQNVYLLRDKVDNVRKALTFISYIDVPFMRNKFTDIIKLENINVSTFKENLIKFLPHSGVKVAENINDIGIVLEEISEINSLFVVADKKEWLTAIYYWKEQLDNLDMNEEEKHIFVFQPNNRKAVELQSIIKLLLKEPIVKTDTNSKNDTNINLKSEKNKKDNDTKTEISTVDQSSDQSSVIIDENRNAIILQTTNKEFKKIKAMLEKLDILPKQVLIEVTIAEITLKDSLQYGLEWYLKNTAGSKVSAIGTLDNLSLAGTGLVGSIVNTDFNVIMNAFQEDKLINVLSAPKLVVLDNQDASINVGTEIPILSSSIRTEDTTTTNEKVRDEIEYRQTGITLDVTPTIHSNGTLTLKISQSISEAQTNSTSNISSPLILNRSLDTNVVLNSNQSLMLGGLIKETKSDTITKVPFLGDLPFIGNLFKNNSKSTDKTELIIVVKPIILNNNKESTIITQKVLELISNN